MNAIIMEPNKKAEVREIDDSLKSMQEIVGGSIELFCPFEDSSIGIIVNEEGKLLNLPWNRVVIQNAKAIDIISGTAFIINIGSEDGNFLSLSNKQIETLMPKISNSTILC